MRWCLRPSRELRERGHDVLAIAEHPGWAALSNPEVLAVASAHHDAGLEVLKAAARQRSARPNDTDEGDMAITERDGFLGVLRRESAA